MDNIWNAMYVSIMDVTSSCFFKDVFLGMVIVLVVWIVVWLQIQESPQKV